MPASPAPRPPAELFCAAYPENPSNLRFLKALGLERLYVPGSIAVSGDGAGRADACRSPRDGVSFLKDSCRCGPRLPPVRHGIPCVQRPRGVGEGDLTHARQNARDPSRPPPPPFALTFPVVVIGFGLLALAAPLKDAEQPLRRVGVLLAFGGRTRGPARHPQGRHRRPASRGRRRRPQPADGAAGVLRPRLAGDPAVVLLLAVTFAVDGLGYVGAARRSGGRRGCSRGLRRRATSGRPSRSSSRSADRARPGSSRSRLALRLFGIAWAMAVTPVHTTERRGRDRHRRPRVSPIIRKPPICSRRSPSRRTVRTSSDRRWTARVHRHALRDSHRAPGDRTARCSGTPRRPSRSSATWCSRCSSPSSSPRPVALSLRDVDAVARTDGLALVPLGRRRPARRPRRRLARAWLRYRLRDGACGCARRASPSRRALAQPGGRPPGRGDRRGDGADVGHELVLRHGELGVGDLELLGGSTDRHAGAKPWCAPSPDPRARSAIAVRGEAAGGAIAETSASSSSAIPAKATRRSMRCAISC